MADVENNSSLLQKGQEFVSSLSKREGPYRRFIVNHYRKTEERATTLTDTELGEQIDRYKKAEPRNTIIISSLGLLNFIGLTQIGLDTGLLTPTIMALSAGPAAVGIGFAGPTRGIVRGNEKAIMQEEQRRRVVVTQQDMGFTEDVSNLLAGGLYDANLGSGKEKASVKEAISSFFSETYSRLEEQQPDFSKWQKSDVLEKMDNVAENYASDPNKDLQRGGGIAYATVLNESPVSYDLLVFADQLKSSKHPILNKAGNWLFVDAKRPQP